MRQSPVKSKRYKWLVFSCIGALLFVVAVAGVGLLRLRSNVQTASLNIGQYSDGNLVDGPLDILVIGSDTRQGENANYGDAQDALSSARSDVMMLLQVSQDKQKVTVLSFPRDLMVSIPKCTDPDTGDVYPASQDTQINESLSHGGPGCTVATISSITGINIDHFVLADFNAVKALSNAVGGVEVCVSEEIDDSYSGLKLPAGVSTVEGEQALAFLRSRHGYGDGSDTSRISAQQSFLASLLRKAQTEGTLANPSKMMNIAEAITQNATVDDGLTNPATLVNIGSMFAGVDLSKVVFATVPNEPYDYDENKLQLSDSAQEVFKLMREDKGLTDESDSSEPSASASTTAQAEQETSLVDHSISVTIVNGSGKEGRGQEISELLSDAGFTQVEAEDSKSQYSASAIYYPAGFEAEAQALADQLGISQVQVSASYPSIHLVIGTDFSQGDKLNQESSAIAGNASGQTAEQVTCQQSFEF